MNNNGEIDKFYKGRTIFITGASGFMGKVLLEKLLNDCPSLKRIYILVRFKRNMSASVRLEKMFQLPLFDRLRSKGKESFNKVIAISGDVSLPELGLEEKDKLLLTKEVNIIFHCAASLRFEAKLKEMVNINLAGTQRVIDLAYKMEQLQLFIHTSTAFCHVEVDKLKEEVYENETDPDNIMKLVEWMDTDCLAVVEPTLLGPHPNCYTYTKRLAETLIDNNYPKLPVAIVRPCIITPAMREPVLGWVDNLNGPMGILVGAGKGVIRTMYLNADNYAEVCPVDHAINAIIAFSWMLGTNKITQNRTPILNITERENVPTKWQTIIDTSKDVFHEYPFEMMLWYPDGNVHPNYYVHKLCLILFQWIPAYFIDFLMFIFRQPRFMVKIQTKVTTGMELLQYFTIKNWLFHSDTMKLLKISLKGSDRERFTLATDDFDIKSYLKHCILGARTYLMKEDPKTIPRQKKVLKLMYVLHKFVLLLFYALLIYIMISIYDGAKSLFHCKNTILQHHL